MAIAKGANKANRGPNVPATSHNSGSKTSKPTGPAGSSKSDTNSERNAKSPTPAENLKPLLRKISLDDSDSDRSQSGSHAGTYADRSHHHSNMFQLDDVAACLRSFAQATGWAIRSTAPRSYSNDSSAAGTRFTGSSSSGSHSGSSESGNNSSNHSASSGKPRWRVVDASPQDGILSADDLAHFPTVTLEHAEDLLSKIESLVTRLEAAEQTVRRQEAELATNVSISRQPDEQQELADRLEAILASATKSIHATACAVYLLDETTSELKLRSRFGLPISRLTDPPRPLRGSLADLEALMGNAVLLEDTFSMPAWKSPEDFPSAIVVPIGSSSMPHGTIWFWSNEARKYTTAEVEIANLTAGRVMGELEQTILGKEVQQAKRLRNQVDKAATAQAARLPDGQPLHRDFDFDGWTYQGDSLGGGFHDWDVTPSSMLVASVGSAGKTGTEGALIASSIQSAFRTLWPTKSIPAQMMQFAADMMFGIHPDDWTASAALLQLNPESGYGMLSTAGSVQAFIISQRGFRPIGAVAPALASQPDASYKNHRFMLQPQEVLVAFSDTVVRGIPTFQEPRNGRPLDRSQTARNRRAVVKSLDQNELLQGIRERIGDSASLIAGNLARMLPAFVEAANATDRSLIVIKNKRRE
jgi:phosphoserine phosphatase RsbU/P